MASWFGPSAYVIPDSFRDLVLDLEFTFQSPALWAGFFTHPAMFAVCRGFVFLTAMSEGFILLRQI